MKMYSDVQQYFLTASFLTAGVVVGYVVLFWIAKGLARLTSYTFRLPWFAHAACLLCAWLVAPMVALFFVDRPSDLMGNGKALLVGALAALIVIGAAEEFARKPREGVNG
jgi:fucose 4-O-acetylase-like acetyltransferase